MSSPPDAKRRHKEGQKNAAEALAHSQTVEKMDLEIVKVENEIAANASSFENCRRLMALGVSSSVAQKQTKQMDELLDKLRQLKETRQEVIDKRYMSLDVHTKIEEDERKPSAVKIGCIGGCKNTIYAPRQCAVICVDCGTICQDMRCDQDNIACAMEKNGNRADAPRRRSGGYKPPNHFAEIVGHFQGVRGSTAPTAVIERLHQYCRRYKYEDHSITPKVVKFFLKRMQQEENNRHRVALCTNPADKLKRYTDYYKSAPEISYKLSGIPPPYMSPMQEDRVLVLFPLVIAAYKTSPRYVSKMSTKVNSIKKTPNNPNYSFVFYKLCQVLGYDEFLPYIPLPKSTQSIDENDCATWKHVCEVNGWQYFPTR